VKTDFHYDLVSMTNCSRDELRIKIYKRRLASSGKRKQVYYTIIPLLVIVMHDDDSDNIVTTSGGFHMCPVCVSVFKSATLIAKFTAKSYTDDHRI